ncbi:MAG: MBL fold metallo-hydrolase [Pseudoxanthomonas sp.]
MSNPTAPRLRRMLLACALLGAFAAIGGTPAQSPPGYYRQAVGALKVTALFDGLAPLPAAQLHGIEPAQARALNDADFVPQTSEGLQTSFAAYLIDDGQRRVLVDAGAGDCLGPALGHVPDSLLAAGYRPAQISDILITHTHPDHLCGVRTADGRRAYPNATLWIAREDAAFWLDPATEKRRDVPAFLRQFLGAARAAAQPYREAGKLMLFDAGQALPGGAAAIAAHGHTPGHSAFLFGAEGGERLLVWGDTVHYHAVQFAHPEAWYEPDGDHAAAIAARRDLLARASRGRWWVAGAHLPFPGLGHVRAATDGYDWVPAEYAPLPAAD